eukprot:372811_1
MTTSQPSLLDPDKFGLLIQCRQKMDQLNTGQLQHYAKSVLTLLSDTQLKQLLFVGCNAIKNHIEYHQLFGMKSCINQIIEEINKEKALKKKQKTREMHKSPITNIPKNASLTKYIPSDIISNNICHFLKMSSITTLAQCDRQLAVICHTPTSICNLMHRYDPYRYNPREFYSNELIDGGYCNMETWNPSTMHRFKNVEKLSVALEFFNDNAANLITTLSNLRQLSLFDISVTDLYAYVRYSNSQVLSLLESISFVHTRELPPVLCMLKLGLADKLKSISFIDSNLDSLNDYGYEDEDDDDNVDPIYSEYENIVNYILPLQPNNLEVIRFENSSLDRELSNKCDDANNAFLNVDRLRLSLSKLKGIVYSERVTGGTLNSDNMFFHLTTNIVNNISSLKLLESIHIHCLKDHQLLTSFLNRNNMNSFNAITELCISVPIDARQSAGSPLGCLSSFSTELEKLCLVIYISPTDSKNMNTLGLTIASILQKQTKLKLFQIVIIMDETQGIHERTDPQFCTKRIAVLNELLKKLAKSFNALHCKSRVNCRPLVFRIHVKSCHKTRKSQCKTDTNESMDVFANTIQNVLLNYLMTYRLGKIQIKLSWNTYGWGHSLLAYESRSYLQALTRLFRIEIEEGGSVEEDANAIATLYTDRDFKQYAISASNKDIEDKNTKYHENKWKVDCRYCCNTPWV